MCANSAVSSVRETDFSVSGMWRHGEDPKTISSCSLPEAPQFYSNYLNVNLESESNNLLHFLCCVKCDTMGGAIQNIFKTDKAWVQSYQNTCWMLSRKKKSKHFGWISFLYLMDSLLNALILLTFSEAPERVFLRHLADDLFFQAGWESLCRRQTMEHLSVRWLLLCYLWYPPARGSSASICFKKLWRKISHKTIVFSLYLNTEVSRR